MFELSDPRSWTYFTNWVLVVVAFVAAGYIAFRFLQEKRAHRPANEDAHTLVLPDLGITMADGGEKVAESKKQSTKA
jgi:hypothetical protein